METFYLKGEEIKHFPEYAFPGLQKALSMKRDDVVEKIMRADLKDRGGSEYPTGLKWSMVLKQNREEKYMICNGDEGEKVSYKNRYLMKNRPLKILEGIIIGAYAIGANSGYIYVKENYKESTDIFQEVIESAYRTNVLGENIYDSNFSFDLELIKGPDKLYCKDDAALLDIIEGEEVQLREEFLGTVENGLYGKPTAIEDVETLAVVAEILNSGVKKYISMGTENSRGTKLISLNGDINEPGVYEVEFGSLTLKEIIEKPGEGIKNGHNLKFLFPGGITNPILSEEELNLPYTYENLHTAGTRPGVGSFTVVSDDQNLIELIKKVAEFFVDNLCVSCPACHEVNKKIYNIISDINEKFTEDEREEIEDIANNLPRECKGKGQSVVNFVESVFMRFGDELV